jgi:hypothetical protein
VRGVVVARREPVVVAVAEFPGPQVVGVGPLQEVHPPGHGAEVPVQDRGVAVHLPHRPRDDHPGVAPGRRAGAAQGELRGDVGEGPGGQLGVGDVVEPLGEERGDVAVVAGGAGEDLGVAEPAEPFVALRAVGGDADEVAPLAPVDDAEQLVQPRH